VRAHRSDLAAEPWFVVVHGVFQNAAKSNRRREGAAQSEFFHRFADTFLNPAKFGISSRDRHATVTFGLYKGAVKPHSTPTTSATCCMSK
jgi:hypothetical protein